MLVLSSCILVEKKLSPHACGSARFVDMSPAVSLRLYKRGCLMDSPPCRFFCRNLSGPAGCCLIVQPCGYGCFQSLARIPRAADPGYIQACILSWRNHGQSIFVPQGRSPGTTIYNIYSLISLYYPGIQNLPCIGSCGSNQGTRYQ